MRRAAAAVALGVACAAVWLGLRAARRAAEPVVSPGSRVTVSVAVEVDGRLVDSTMGREPVVLEPGSGAFVRGLEEGVVGMALGEERDIVVAPAAGYGPRDPALVEAVPLASFGDMARSLKPGAKTYGVKDGRPVEARVVEVKGDRVVLDFNHPYAGKTIRFKVKALEVR